MKFAEVAIILREIVDACPSLDGSKIILTPQEARYHLYQGYHIYIKASLSNESIGCLRKIVEGHDLLMKIKTDGIIIYESRPSSY